MRSGDRECWTCSARIPEGTYGDVGAIWHFHTIHHTHQLRLVNSVQVVFHAARSTDRDLLNAILNFPCWSLYAQGPKTEDQIRAHRAKVVSGPVLPLWPWLDHPIARQKIEHAFAEYKKQLIASVDSLELATVTWLQNIFQGLKSWHTERDQ